MAMINDSLKNLKTTAAQLEQAVVEYDAEVAAKTAALAKVAALDKQATELKNQNSVLTTDKAGLVRDLDTARARIKELEALIPKPVPVFSWDVSSLGADGAIAEATKINSHKSMLGVDNIQNVREFFPSVAGINWNSARLAALTDKDSVLISFKAWDRAAFKKVLAATPAKFRKRPGQVKWCFHHEFEAEWASAPDKAVWLANYLTAYKEMAEELDASAFDTQSRDDVVKIFLWYSQHIDGRTKGLWKQFIGDQKFGMIGMDCYHYAVWVQQRGRYATPAELFSLLNTMGSETGLPICVPEWGCAGMVAGDDGTGLAKAIREGGDYLKSINVRFANWWCAAGSKDPDGNVRDHHVDNIPPAKAALKMLVSGK